ncbi:MAG: sigma-70 family RNA polymerase sigma factor [Bryobacteraceae bacterium]|nr:sigma-70 family RNA polymerase sigma factor [Bryobacteraceae bacterium]
MSPSGLSSGSTDITSLLMRWRAGDSQAFDSASAIVYPELRRIAGAYLRRERAGHTLQPTALVNEAFLRLAAAGNLRFDSRKHFFALAAQLMRQILVDHARSIKADKRGGGAAKLPLDAVRDYQPQFADQFLMVHDALDQLHKLNPRKAQIIELRYFGGLTLEEIAEFFEISIATAHREQRLAEAWLTAKLSE